MKRHEQVIQSSVESDLALIGFAVERLAVPRIARCARVEEEILSAAIL